MVVAIFFIRSGFHGTKRPSGRQENHAYIPLEYLHSRVRQKQLIITRQVTGRKILRVLNNSKFIIQNS